MNTFLLLDYLYLTFLFLTLIFNIIIFALLNFRALNNLIVFFRIFQILKILFTLFIKLPQFLARFKFIEVKF